MKSIISRYTVFMIAFMSLICGCNQDINHMDDGGNGSLSHVRFDLRLAVRQDVDTRASGRQLINSDAAQDVSNVRIYLFRAPLNADPKDDSAFKYYKMPAKDGGAPKDYFYVPSFEKDAIWDSDKEETHVYIIDPFLEKGYQYKLLAIGRDDVKEGDSDPGTLLLSTTEGATGWSDISTDPAQATTLHQAAMSINITRVRLCVGELFVGCSEALIVDDEDENFLTDILLTRSVAGVLMYLENIPSHFNALTDITRPGIIPPYKPMSLITKGKEYKVSSIAIAPAVISTGVEMIGRGPCGNPEPNQNFRWYLVDANLLSAQEKDGYFVNTNPDNEKHPNSLLAGNFILPVNSHEGTDIIGDYEKFDHTLYLVFYTNDNDLDDHTFATPFFWYPIENIRQTYDAVTGGYIDDPAASLEVSYPLHANHIYSLGERYGNVDAPLDLSALKTLQPDTRSTNTPALQLIIKSR